ncbi:MAG: hypothetical protein HFH87_11555, partial [Lachnospiraceae bacterium]|nr:hypothetical protein [Lachnospiraceae bacterium]
GQKRQEGKIDFLAFNFVVQRDNYLEMPGFVRMCLDFHADEIKFSRIFNWGGEPEEVFERISMFDTNGDMKSELAGLVENEIFKRPEVRLFKWVNW